MHNLCTRNTILQIVQITVLNGENIKNYDISRFEPESSVCVLMYIIYNHKRIEGTILSYIIVGYFVTIFKVKILNISLKGCVTYIKKKKKEKLNF